MDPSLDNTDTPTPAEIGAAVSATTAQVLNSITAFNKGQTYNPQSGQTSYTLSSNYYLLAILVIGGLIAVKVLL